MSGLEVVGVVLGVLPMVLKSLNFYIEGVDALRLYASYKRELRTLHSRISAEHLLFCDVLEKLLDGILSPADIEPLIACPLGEAWNSPHVKHRIKARLQNSYIVYMAIMTNIYQAVKGIMEKMKIDDTGKVRFSDASAIQREKEHLKFSLNKRKYDIYVSQISADISRLERLTKSSLHLEASRRLRFVPQLESARTSAKSVYDALYSSWSCACKEHHSLSLSLGLSLDLATRKDNMMFEERSLEYISCRIMFCNNEGHIEGTQIWRQAQVEVRTILQGLPNPLEDRCSDSVARSATFSSKATPKVTVSNLVTSMKPKQIEDLCGQISVFQTQPDGMSVGFVLDSDAQIKHQIYTLEQQASDPPLSLKQMILENHEFPKSKRVELLVVLVSTMLRLGQTQWIDDDWSMKDVILLERDGKPVLEHAFICKAMKKKIDSAMVDYRMSNIQNRPLFSLGILFMEVWFNKTIEDLSVEAAAADFLIEAKNGIRMINWRTMEALLSYVEGQIGPRFRKIVEMCVCANIVDRDKGFEAESFRTGVIDGVIAGLKHVYKQWTHPKK